MWAPLLVDGQCVINWELRLVGRTLKQPLSTVASVRGSQTVSTSASSASARTTPLSWCQGIVAIRPSPFGTVPSGSFIRT